MSQQKVTPKPSITGLASGLRLLRNPNGTFTDQYGRVLEEYTNAQGKPDLRPIGLDPQGAKH